MYLLGAVNVFSGQQHVPGEYQCNLGKKLLLRTSTNPNVTTTLTGGSTLFTAPTSAPHTWAWATSSARGWPR